VVPLLPSLGPPATGASSRVGATSCVDVKMQFRPTVASSRVGEGMAVGMPLRLTATAWSAVRPHGGGGGGGGGGADAGGRAPD
jgi:hypothetical protein